MIWQTTNFKKAIQSLFIGKEGAVGLINDFKLDLMDPISLDVTLPRGTAPDIRPANQVISILRACSVRSKRRHGECAGEHSASLCAPSIFSNEVSANVARQSSFSLRGHNTENTQKQGSESLPTHFMKNEKTMKNRSNPFSVSSSGQSYNTKANRFAGRLRSAGLISIALALISHAVIIALALAGVNLALIGAIWLLLYIIFGCLASRSVTNCHRIQ